MSKFVTDDGLGGISGDRFMDELNRKNNQTYTESWIAAHPVRKHHTDVNKMKMPPGRRNCDRLLNSNMYDLLAHIQQTLSLTGRCILEMITNEDHKCLNMNPTIQHRINLFAMERIDDNFRKAYPKYTIRVKVDGTEDEYTSRLETDEEWNDRLCHMYMHKNHPSKLQMIKCEECLQHWMNDDKW